MSIYKGTTLIAGSLPNAANQDLSNLSQTGQAVIDGKADTDLSNATDNGKILMSSMGMPSDKYIDLTLGASGSTYTAPANGWVVFTGEGNGYISLIVSGVAVFNTNQTNGGGWYSIIAPVRKGASFTVGYVNVTNRGFNFIYAVGSESEAS